MAIYSIDELKSDNVRGGKGKANIFNLIKDYQVDITYVGVVELEPLATIAEHTHLDDRELYFVIEGEGVFIENGEKNYIKRGYYGAINRGDSHGIENTSKTEKLKIVAIVIK